MRKTNGVDKIIVGNTQNNQIYFLILIVVGVFVLAIVCVGIYVEFIRPFLKRREYLIMEMKRSTKKSEYLYWKGKLKKLYLQHNPLIGRFFRY